MSVSKVENSSTIVNLTKKRVTEQEAERKKEIYRTCVDINKLINEYYAMYLSYQKNNICNNNDPMTINEFMDCTIWNLYETLENDYAKAYQYILHNPKSILPNDIFDLTFINNIEDNVIRRITFTNKVINLDLKLIVTDENPVSKIKQIMNLDDINLTCMIKALVMTSPFYRVRIEGDFDNFIDIIECIRNRIIENSKNINATLQFSDPKVEKEATCKIKYYSDYDLSKI